MNFTEMSKGLSMASELPKVILSSRRDLDRDFVLRELAACLRLVGQWASPLETLSPSSARLASPGRSWPPHWTWGPEFGPVGGGAS